MASRLQNVDVSIDVQAFVKTPGGFGIKSVSITSGWPSSLVSKAYEFAASCVCPGSSHHTGRLGLLGTEARRHRKFSDNTHHGLHEPAAGKKPPTLQSPPMALPAGGLALPVGGASISTTVTNAALFFFFCQAGDVIFLNPSQSNMYASRHTHTHLLKKMPLKLARY